MRPLRKRATEIETRADTLARLLASEERLTRQLESAREEADRIVRAAEAYARQTEDACAATIEERAVSLAALAEQEIREEIDRIRAEAKAEVHRLESAAADRLPELVRLVLEKLGAPGTEVWVEQTG